MLDISAVTKRFSGVSALQDLSLSVAAGHIYALLGPNGAGKTTTMHVILGFLSPDHGRIIVDGRDRTHEPVGANRDVAYLPEQVALYPLLTGLENLAFFTDLSDQCWSPADLRRMLMEAGLPEQALSARTATYSKGMRQKVGLALALAMKAKVLLLDEPTSGLDPQAIDDLTAHLRLLSQQGVAVLLATHDLWFATATASCVGMLYRGRLVAEQGLMDGTDSDVERFYIEALRRSREMEQ